MINLPGFISKLKYHRLPQQAFFAATLRPARPHSLNIEVTNLCNERCVMCPRHKTNRPMGLIEPKLFYRIIDQLAEERYRLWTLTLIKDGEPLLHPQLDALINYAAAKKVARTIEIFTNGILLNRNNWGERLLKSGLTTLNISLDATTREVYRKIRGVDVYKQVVANVRDLARLKRTLKVATPRLVIRAVGMKANAGQLAQLKRRWQGVVDDVAITPFANYGGGVSEKLGLPKFFSATRWPCLVLWYNPVINWDGTVTTCCVNYMDNELTMGDIRKNTLTEIWQSPKYRQVRQDHLNGKLEQWPTCAKCTYWRKFANMNWFLKRFMMKS